MVPKPLVHLCQYIIIWKENLNSYIQQFLIRRGVVDATLCDEVSYWLAAGRWFSLGTLVSSTNKTDCHNITEILLKVALNTTTLTAEQFHHQQHKGPSCISHLNSLNTKKKKTMTYGVRNQGHGLRQEQKCGSVKLFSGIPFSSLLRIRSPRATQMYTYHVKSSQII
jgi:hypothetical protein